MNIGDTLALVRAGYKAGDIKEISALSEGNVEIVELAKSASGMDEFKTLLEISREDPKQQTDPEPPADAGNGTQTAPETFEKENAELKKALEETRAQLAQAQKANLSANRSDGDGDKTEERLADMMRSLY